MTFAPSLYDSSAKVTRAPYGGHIHSLDTIAARIREGSISPRIRAWAAKAMLAAGIDGRTGVDQTRSRVAAILNAFRSQTTYTADPVGRELIQSAEVTLCLDPNLCISTGDCDDSVTAVGCATTSIGIPTMIVKEDYPDGQQSHVLLACRDESGNWFLVDPSTNKPVGESYAPRGTKRTWINPLEGVPVELIGIGHAPLGRPFTSGSETLGADPTPPPPGPFAVQIPGNWTPVVNNQLTAGLRYAIGIVTPDTWTEADVRNYFNSPLGSVTAIVGPPLMIETVQLVEGVYQTFNPWIVTGIAKQDSVAQDNAAAGIKISAVLQEVPAPPAQQPGPPPAPGGAPKAPPAPSGISLGSALLVALGVASLGGLAYGAYEYKKKHKRGLLSNPIPRRKRLRS